MDVEDACLVRAESDNSMPYLALSYVWGQGRSDCAKKKNMDALRERGGLAKHMVLPRTVADAIRLTGLLGYRYIWVDRFCIIQDDDRPDKQAELSHMGSIYAGAAATVVAATGIASQPLVGIPGVTGRRYLSKPSARLRGDLSSKSFDYRAERAPRDDDISGNRQGWEYRTEPVLDVVAAKKRMELINTPATECSLIIRSPISRDGSDTAWLQSSDTSSWWSWPTP